jgi:hypothetical protein
MRVAEGRPTTMFAWGYLDRSGHDRGTSDPFPDQDAAEDWMSNAWKELRERGIEEVELIDREREEVLYRMGLSGSQS